MWINMSVIVKLRSCKLYLMYVVKYCITVLAATKELKTKAILSFNNIIAMYM